MSTGLKPDLGTQLATLVNNRLGNGLRESGRNVLQQHNLLVPPENADTVQSILTYAMELLGTTRQDPVSRDGAYQLELAVQECPSPTFLINLHQTVAILNQHLSGQLGQISEETQLSCWRVLNRIYARLKDLIHLPGVKQEAHKRAKDVVQLMLKSIEGSKSEALATEQWLTVASIIQVLAPSLKSFGKEFEKTLVNNILLADSPSTPMRLAGSRVLALLPQINGESQSWSILMQRLILTSHNILNGAFLGLEDEAQAASARLTISPNIATLGDDKVWKFSSASAEKEQTWLRSLGGLLDCMERMMTDAQPWPVKLPASPFFMLLLRILSFRPSGKTPSSASAYIELMAELPCLQAASLKLLRVWLRAGKASLTPSFASLSRFLADLLANASMKSSQKQTAWQTRLEVYSAAADLVDIAGYGAARNLLQATLQASVSELMPDAASTDVAEAPRPSKKARKSKSKEVDLEALIDATPEVSKSILPPPVEEREASCRRACLTLLENILKVSGAALPTRQRLELDLLLLKVAERSSQDLLQVSVQKIGPGSEKAAKNHLACLKALATSVTAPSNARPPFLPQAMAMYRQGLQSSQPELAAFCSSALLGCEAFLHPRTAVQLLPADLDISSQPPIALQNGLHALSGVAIGGTQSSEHEAAFPSLDSSRGNAQSSGLVVSPELLTHRADDAEDQQENSLKLQQGKESRSEKPQPGQDIPSMSQGHSPAGLANSQNAPPDPILSDPGSAAVVETNNQFRNHSAYDGSDSAVAEFSRAGNLDTSKKPTSMIKPVQQTGFLGQDSSDSEGPLPEIDIGSSSEERED